MNSRMTREQKKKLLLAEGALHRFECVQARRALADELGSMARGGPANVLRAVSGRTLLSVAATALPLVLGAGRVARLLKRAMLVAGGVAAAWSAISRWREQTAEQGGTTDDKQDRAATTAADTAAPPPDTTGGAGK